MLRIWQTIRWMVPLVLIVTVFGSIAIAGTEVLDQAKRRFATAQKIKQELKRRNEFLRIIVELKEFTEANQNHSRLQEAMYLIGTAYQQLALDTRDRGDGNRALHYFKNVEKSEAASSIKNLALAGIAEVCEKVFRDKRCHEEALSQVEEQVTNNDSFVPLDLESLSNDTVENKSTTPNTLTPNSFALIQSISIEPQISGISVKVNMDQSVTKYSYRYLRSEQKKDLPPRFYIDIEQAKVHAGTMLPQLSENGLIASVRLAQNTSEKARLVLDLHRSLREEDFQVSLKEKALWINIDQGLYHADKDPSALIQWSGEPTDTDEVPLRSLIKKSQYKIVLDPGHGGDDVGAKGPRGTFEKDVCLDIAIQLRKLLKKNAKYIVYMTRQDDKTLTLADRTLFANNMDGDLFVSIHANASPKKTAKGISTYFLHNADDQESLRVAMRENGELLGGQGEQNLSEDHYLEVMKASMVKNFHTVQSTDLARQIQTSMLSELKRKYRGITDLGVRSARFYVLTGTRMPAVLVETSFISNSDEEKRLKNPAYQNTIAKAIQQAIDQYFKAREKVPLHMSYFHSEK